jgi:NitT/TauT family transport system substrate-binding protein
VAERLRLVAACLAATALLGVASCRRAPERLTIGHAPQPGTGLLLIAHARGYFADEGVEVVFREYGSGRDALAAVYAGEVDAAAAYLAPIAARAFETEDLRVLTTLHWSTADHRVLARRDRGVGAPGDLRGRRLGVPFGTSAELFLDTLLASAGVRPAEVTRVNVEPAEAGPALAGGEVDAIAVWFPHAAELEDQGGVLELRSSSDPQLSVLATRAPTLEAKRDALRRVLRALLRAERLAREAPADALAALEQGLPVWPPPLVREGWGRVNPQLGLSNLLLASLERHAAAHADRMRRRAAPELRRLLDDRLLLELDREAVTLLGGR